MWAAVSVSGRARRVLAVVGLVGALCGLAPSAHASGCHEEPLAQVPGKLLVQAHYEARNFSDASWSGSAEGVGLALALPLGPLVASGALTTYRLVYNGLEVRGLGDLRLQLAWPELWQSRWLWVGGAAFGHLPTGDAAQHLGNGHSMLGAGAHVGVRVNGAAREAVLHGPWLLALLRVSYASALGQVTHQHRTVFVNPMFSEQLELLGDLSLRMVGPLRLGASAELAASASAGAVRANLCGVFLVNASLANTSPAGGSPADGSLSGAHALRASVQACAAAVGEPTGTLLRSALSYSF